MVYAQSFLLTLLACVAVSPSHCCSAFTSNAKSYRTITSINKLLLSNTGHGNAEHDKECNRNCEDFNSDALGKYNGSRRSFIKSASLSFAGVVSAGPLATSLTNNNFVSINGDKAQAMGLVTFPCPAGSLMNNYHIMRAGQSLLEEKNILSTNPLFL